LISLRTAAAVAAAATTVRSRGIHAFEKSNLIISKLGNADGIWKMFLSLIDHEFNLTTELESFRLRPRIELLQKAEIWISRMRIQK